MERTNGRYVWFDGVEIIHSEASLNPHCVVNEILVPLPIMILHPDCKLRKAGDKGRLGVPKAWAIGFGLISRD